MQNTRVVSLGNNLRTYAIGLGAALLLVSTVAAGTYLGHQTQLRFRSVSSSWLTYSETADRKGRWLSALRGHLGYGGIIHDFKNYVLRQDNRYLLAVQRRLPEFYRITDAYLAADMAADERDALWTIRHTIESYEAKLVLAERAAHENWPIAETDRLVRVDDTAAIAALLSLESIWQATRERATADIQRAVAEGEALIDTGFRFLFALAAVAVTLFGLYYLLVRQLGGTVGRLSSELHERLRAEQAEKKLLRAVEQIPATIVITDTRGRIEYVNHRFEELTGYSRAEVAGRTPRFLQSGDTSPDQYGSIRAVLASGQEFRGTFRNRKKDGGSYWADTTILPLTDDDNVVRNFIGIGEDVTEKRRAREQVIKAQKMEAVGLLAGGVAHDFNNVLTTIIGAAHLASLDLEPDSDPGKEVAQIAIAARRAQALVGQLLTFARRQPAEPRRLDLRREVTEVARLIKASVPRTIEVRTDLGQAPAWIRADPTQLHQVLMNLCRNAAEAVPADTGVICIAIEQRPMVALEIAGNHGVERWLRLIVGDNGPGIEPGVAGKMFDAFFTTKPLGKGTGLGLTMVANLLEDMGGSITLTTRAPEGARFEILLPETAPGTEREELGEALPRGSESVLLIDDEADVLSVERRLLMRLGYRVSAYTDPAAAVADFGRDPGRFDLVITDLVMPGMSGEAVAQEVARLEPQCPILISTAYPPASRPHSLVPHAAILAKPASPLEFARKIRTLLDAAK